MEAAARAEMQGAGLYGQVAVAQQAKPQQSMGSARLQPPLMSLELNLQHADLLLSDSQLVGAVPGKLFAHGPSKNCCSSIPLMCLVMLHG